MGAITFVKLSDTHSKSNHTAKVHNNPSKCVWTTALFRTSTSVRRRAYLNFNIRIFRNIIPAQASGKTVINPHTYKSVYLYA